MKKFFAIILAMMTVLTFASCDAASVPDEAGGYYSHSSAGVGGAGYKVEADGGVEAPAFGDAPAEDYEKVEWGCMMEDEAADASESGGSSSQRPSAGLLTAGEWKDMEDIDFWTSLLERDGWNSMMERRDLYTNKIKVISVKDEDGAPLYNAKVELFGMDGSKLFTARTDISGSAYLFYNINNDDSDIPSRAVINGITEARLSQDITEVTLSTEGTDVEALDLMFMVDTTGSMSDELRYLQSELEDVIKRVSSSSGNLLSIRVSVNFYRDVGDEYVVRPFDFTGNMSEVMNDLSSQSANGGGDTPEAVHSALQNAIFEHQWRDEAVKLMFFVLDAPPHTEEEVQGVNSNIQRSLIKAAEMGVRIIPVASSGVDTETEFLLRSYASMTGGTYIFLTDHSGIGGDHLEPTIGQYEVELLNECLIRVISEYCGLIVPDVKENGNEKEADSLVAWANWTGDTEKISRLACNADKLLEGADRLPIYKCESLEELEKFKSINSDIYSMNGKWDEIGSFNDATANFGEEYFKDGALLIVYVATNSCTPRYDLHSIVGTDNGITVYIEQTNDPKVFDEAMGGWLITVPVEKTLIQNATAFDAMMK